ncbi:MAG: hypothetical protein L0241_31740 [Planctomycetia bacterium]|nr:hypothetical protein [Planctomycetia bacterium]
MTGTEPDTVPTNEPELSIQEYTALLKELGQQFLMPTWEEVKPDWQWVHGRMEAGTLDPEGKWSDRHIAVYQGQVIGSDTNPLRLRLTKARELGIHPERLVITYLF